MFIQYSPSSSYSLCVIHLNSYSCHSANSVIIQFIQSSSILLQYRPVYYSLRPSSYSHPPVFAPVHTVFIVQSTTVFAQFRQSSSSSSDSLYIHLNSYNLRPSSDSLHRPVHTVIIYYTTVSSNHRPTIVQSSPCSYSLCVFI